jgi:hypothetical protein
VIRLAGGVALSFASLRRTDTLTQSSVRQETDSREQASHRGLKRMLFLIEPPSNFQRLQLSPAAHPTNWIIAPARATRAGATLTEQLSNFVKCRQTSTSVCSRSRFKKSYESADKVLIKV